MPRKARDVPWLDKVGDVYYAHWYEKHPRRTRRLTLDTSEAETAQARFAQFLIQGPAAFSLTAPEPKGGGLGVVTVIDDYLREHVRAGAVVARERAEDCAANLLEFFGAYLVSEIDIPLCREYAEARRSGDVARTYRDGVTRIPAGDATIRRELGVLQAALGHAVRWKRLARNDVPYIERPKVSTGLAPWLYRDELDLLRRTAKGVAADFVELAYWTASRRHAIETLTVFQIDLEAGLINLSAEGERQTNKRRGLVPIDDALRPTVTRLVHDATAAARSHLLPTAGQPVYRQVVRAAVDAGLRQLPARGLRPPSVFAPHILRHSRATHLLQDGVDPWAVASLLRDNVTTLLATYGHACPEHMRDSLRRQARNAQLGR